jgi:hypothetical protein
MDSKGKNDTSKGAPNVAGILEEVTCNMARGLKVQAGGKKKGTMTWKK